MDGGSFTLKYSLVPSDPMGALETLSWVIWLYPVTLSGGSGRRRYQLNETRTPAKSAVPISNRRHRVRGPRAARPLPSGSLTDSRVSEVFSRTSTLHTNRYPTVVTVWI